MTLLIKNHHVVLKFSVLSRSVNQFNENDHTDCIHRRLKDFYSNEHIDKVILQIRTRVTLINHSIVLATSLQIYMLTEFFCYDPFKYDGLLKKFFFTES